jgi:two-component system sensor histidine kinase KdpD
MTSMGSSNKGYRLLLSLLSHDLKNPLSAIQGYSDLMRYADDEKKAIYSDRISKMVRRMSRTIKLSGMMSKVQNGKLDGEFRTMDISRTIGSAIESLQPRVSDYEISFLRGDGEFLIDGHVFLEQVFIDLIDSAMRRSSKGGRIDIGLSTDLSGLTISVKDQGSSMIESEKGSLLGPEHPGTDESDIDLGLAISRGIVDLHDGRIWVEPNDPTGSIFHVDLPWSNDRS